VQAALLAFLFGASFMCGFSSLGNSALVAWLLLSGIYVHTRYGILSLWLPTCLIWWVGLVPATISLVFYESQFVGIDIRKYPSMMLYTVCFSALLLGAWLAEPSLSPSERSIRASYNEKSARLATWFGVFSLVFSIMFNLSLILQFGNPYEAANPEAARISLESGNGLLGTLAISLAILGVALISVHGLFRRKAEVTILPAIVRITAVFSALAVLGLTGTRLVLAHALLVIFVLECLYR